MKVSAQQLRVDTAAKTARLEGYQGGSREFLKTLAADLIKTDGTVKGGYLKLSVSGDEVNIKSNHIGGGATAATDLVKKLVQDAYGDKATEALNQYLQGKGKDKVGTLSFVKLIKELETNRPDAHLGSNNDQKLQSARGFEDGHLSTIDLALRRQRLNTYPCLADVKAWQDTVMKASTDRPIEALFSEFLQVRGFDWPPLLSAQTREKLFADHGDIRAVRIHVNRAQAMQFVPGGSHYEALLEEATRDVLGHDAPERSISPNGLKEMISDQVIKAASGPGDSIDRLSEETIREIAKREVQARVAYIEGVMHQIDQSDLAPLAKSFAANFLQGSPKSSFKDLSAHAHHASALYQCAKQMASGDTPSALKAFVESARWANPTDKNVSKLVLRAAIRELSPQERLDALQNLSSEPVLIEIQPFEQAWGMVQDAPEEMQFPLMELGGLANELKGLREELGFQVGIPAAVLDLEAVLKSKPPNLAVSPQTQTFARDYIEARRDFAKMTGEPIPPALDVEAFVGLATLVPDQSDTPTAFRAATQAIASQDDRPAFSQTGALVLRAPPEMRGGIQLPAAALAMSGQTRMQEIVSATKEDMTQCKAAGLGAADYEAASESQGYLKQFIIDDIGRHADVFGIKGTHLFEGKAYGADRWSAWQSEIRGAFDHNEAVAVNALNELPALFTQRVQGDLLRLNAQAHGFAPEAVNLDPFKTTFEGVDADGYLGIKMDFHGPAKLFQTQEPFALHAVPSTFDMSARFRYRPSSEPGGTGDLLMDHHVVRYELNSPNI